MPGHNVRRILALPTYRVFERLARLERGNSARRDLNLLSRLRVAPAPSRPLPHFKGAETDDLHPPAVGKGFGHRIKQRIHRLSGVLFRQTAARRDLIDQIRLRHRIHPLPRLDSRPGPAAAPLWEAAGDPNRKGMLSDSRSNYEPNSKKATSRIRAFLRPHAALSCRSLMKKLLQFRAELHNMIQISPPLPSLTIFVNVSWSFRCACSGMRCNLLWIPSRTKSCSDLPRKSEFQTRLGSFSNSSVK